MKNKILFILFVFVSLLLIGCKPDVENEKNLEE